MIQKTIKNNSDEKSVLFTSANHRVLGIGLLVIILGFYALAQMPVDGFVTMYIAPILLVAGFLVIIPIGILLGGSKKNIISSGD